MGRSRHRRALVLPLLGLLAGCSSASTETKQGDGGATHQSDGNATHAEGLSFGTSTLTLDTGSEQALALTATVNGISTDVTTKATLTSSSSAVSISEGNATGVRRGDATITASYGAGTATLSVHVRGWTPLSPEFCQVPGGFTGNNVVVDNNADAIELCNDEIYAYTPDAGWGSSNPLSFEGLEGVVSGTTGLLVSAADSGGSLQAQTYSFATGSVSALSTIASFPSTQTAFLLDVESTTDGSYAIVLIGLSNAADTADEGVGVVRWSASSGWKAFELIDPLGSALEDAVAIDDQGRAVVVYGVSTNAGDASVASPEIRTSSAVWGGSWSTPNTLQMLDSSDDYQCLTASLSSSGTGVVSWSDTPATSVGSGGGAQQLYVAEVTGSVVGSKVTALDPAPVSIFSCGGIATLPSGVTALSRTNANNDLELFLYHPGGMVTKTANWPSGTFYSSLFATTAGDLWLFADTVSGGNIGGNGWFAQRMDPSLGWIKAWQFPGQYLVSMNPFALRSGILGASFYFDDLTTDPDYTVAALYY